MILDKTDLRVKMFNRYFKIVDGNMDFVFANMAIKNINFALISLDYIFNYSDFDKNIYHDEHSFYFFHIQSLLAACGNISNVFYNKNGSIKTTARCARLRKTLNVFKKEFPLVFKKEVRNTNEHFDERYEEIGAVGDYNLLDKNTDSFMRSVIQTNPHLRTYDKDRCIYYTYNSNRQPIEYDLKQLQCELETLLNRITNNELFNSGWEEFIPGETVV